MWGDKKGLLPLRAAGRGGSALWLCVSKLFATYLCAGRVLPGGMSFSIVFERLQAAKSVLCSEIGCKITNFFRNTLSVRSEKRHARFLRAAPHMGVTFSKRHALDGFYCRKCIVTCNPWAISHKFWAEKINLRLTQHVELAESCLQTFAYQCLFAFCAKDGATFILNRAQLKWSCRA